MEGWNIDRCRGTGQGWVWRGEKGRDVEGVSVIGEEELSRDGCGGMGQGPVWSDEAGMGMEG